MTALDPATYEFLDVRVDGTVAVATMNRPEQLNAMSADDHRELPRFLRDLQADDGLHVAVVTAAGRGFSVGGATPFLRELHRSADERAIGYRDARELVHAHIDCEKPVVVAMNGVALGGAVAFALLSDIVIADRSVRFADGHTRGALAAGDGGTLIWPLAVGLTRAKRFLLTSDWITATEGERIGLVTEVVDDGCSLGRALEYATRLANGPQPALRATKRALNQHLRARAVELFEAALHAEFETFASDAVGQVLDDVAAGRPPAIVPETAGVLPERNP